MSDITLSTGIRQNLLSLQQTSADLTTTQEQLATGKKVNTAFDNPTSYFTSQSLTNRANDLSALLDQIGQAQQTLNAANDGLTGLTSLLEQALSTAQQAQQSATGTVSYSAAGLTGTQAIAADYDTSRQHGDRRGRRHRLDRFDPVDVRFQIRRHRATCCRRHADLHAQAGLTVTATFGTGRHRRDQQVQYRRRSDRGSEHRHRHRGNLSTVGFAVTDGAGGVNLTSNDVTHAITTTYQDGGGGTLTAANFANNTVASTQGDALTVSDGTALVEATTMCHRHVARTGRRQCRRRRLPPAPPISEAVNQRGQNQRTARSPRAHGAGNGFLTLAPPAPSRSAANSAPPGPRGPDCERQLQRDVGGARSRQHADRPGRYQHGPYADVRHRHRQITTKAQLTTALSQFTDITGGYDASGDLQFTPTSTNTVTIGGTAGTVTGARPRRRSASLRPRRS